MKKKQLALIAAALVISIGLGVVFSAHVSAASVPSLFHNDERWYRDNSAGLEIIGGLYYGGVLGPAELFLISAAFYVCDLICVLIWCPFRLLMHTRCCTTCRIFNWDHLMMFTPMIFMGGFYAVSLLSLAFLAWLVWEVCIMMYPERFWDKSNAALKCSECTDKLCTQYCQKLRK